MAGEPLKDYRLTPAARSDLEAIWRYTAERWSVAQAEAYLTGLKATLAGLIVNPRIARERTELTPPVRIHPYGSHMVRAEATEELGDGVPRVGAGACGGLVQERLQLGVRLFDRVEVRVTVRKRPTRTSVILMAKH